MTSNTLNAFTFNIQDIPLGLVTYPPGTSPLPAVESPEPSKRKMKSILKRNFEEAFHPYANSSRQLRQVSWSQNSKARLINETTCIDENVQEGKVYSFFYKHGAIQHHLPGGDTAPVSKWSQDPEDVKEVKAIRGSDDALRSLDDKSLLKNYSRLFNKLKHIYSQQRSQAFQQRIWLYLNEYEGEIKTRNLEMPIPSFRS